MDIPMDVRVSRFKARLLNNGIFSIIKNGEFAWSIESNICKIEFIFERFGNGSYMILVSDPRTKEPGANFNILRHIRGARDILADAGSPENFAEIFNKYFSDVLSGDFSVLVEYERLGKAFGVFLIKVLSLDDDDPIKIKMRAWDISWLDDLKKRGG